MLTEQDFLELHNSRGYTYIMKVLTKEFESHQDPDLARKQHWWLRKRWPFDQEVVSLYLKNCLKLGFFEEALEQKVGWKNVSNSFLISGLIQIRAALNRPVFNSSHVERLYRAFVSGIEPLTDFGGENRELILKEVDRILGESFSEGLLEQFCLVDDNGKLKSKGGSNFGILHYPMKGNHLKKVSLACANILREAENNVRLEMGGKRIGEGFVRETELFYRLKEHFKTLNVVHHGKPKFLGRQHFDIWIPALKIAVEYQGIQHDEPVDFFGGEESFKANKERDALKRAKCQKNGVSLIEVRPGYDFQELVTQINNLIEKKK